MSTDAFPWGRAAVAAAVLVHLQLGPFVVEVLGLRRPPTTMAWQMYSGVGLNVCAFEWFERGPDGQARPLDRLAALGTDRHTADYATRFVFGRDNLRARTSELCAALPDRELRVIARCGLRGAWEPIWDLDHDPCGPAPAPKRRRRAP